jgi:2-methylcitrate dehydratase PrpD
MALRQTSTKDEVQSSPRETARSLLFDYLVVARRGAASGPGVTAQRLLDGAGPAVVDGTSRTTSADRAALVNGIAGHSIELDDTYEPASIHPGVVVWPAVLALADEHQVRLDELLDAATAGYDAACALGDRLDPGEVYRRGFHPTGICGPIAAAAAASALLGATPEERQHAVGIAASASSGLLEFLADGAWTKPFHAGHGAASGLQAARLAAVGYTGPRSAIDGPLGFLHAFGGRDDTGEDALYPPVGYGLARTAIKSYPCCRYMHGNMDLLLDLAHDEELDAADVASVSCAVLSAGWGLVADPSAEKLRVHGTVDAQFSMPFGAALALTHRRATLEDFESASEMAHELAPLMRKIECSQSARIETDYPEAWGAEIEVRTRGGAVLRRHQAHIKGSPARPLSPQEHLTKAVGLVGTAAATRLLTACLDSAEDATVAVLRGARQTPPDAQISPAGDNVTTKEE